MSKNPYMPEEAEIIAIRQETKIDYTFRLKSNLKVKSGQFLEVSLPRVGEAPISISDFGKGYLDLTIRRVGRLTNILHNLHVGDKIFIRGPYGNGFPIKEFSGKNVIIAAGGTGLAPVKSILNYYFNGTLQANSLQLLSGFKSPKDILFRLALEKWAKKFPVQVTVDKGDKDWQGRIGLITELIEQLEIPEPEETIVIIVGPPVMMKFSGQAFLKKGVVLQNLYLSFERKMSCGIGKCGHCKINNTYVCLEGPVFTYEKALKLLD